MVAVVGMGYVGMPLAVTVADAGFSVLALDIDEARVAAIARGESYIGDIPSERLSLLVKAGKIRSTARFRELQDADAIIVCVPTPLNKTKEPDLSYVVSALREIKAYLRRGQLIILESTTYPGFTREVGLPMLEEVGYRCGEEFFLTFSPERTDPGNPRYGVSNTTKVLGGVTPTCTEMGAALYRQVIETVHVVSSTDAAEMAKLLENTFRAVNIGLVNEVALMCNTLGIDTWEVIAAASTKPFGFMPFYPGPGLGGHCLPIDPLYLSWKLRSHNYTARFIELAQTINASMPGFVVQLAADTLNDHSRAVRGSRICLYGVAYKPNIDDVRESPALEIIELLHRKGADVVYTDPHVPAIEVEGRRYASVSESDARTSDLAIITTDHTAFDLVALARDGHLILDTRNATRRAGVPAEYLHKVVRL
ncbi:MAG: nucleotide sugar dehydrogenase [Myxococcales bacterium]|nr:nucleotide sugar dehydrogenase [Myxococcales bacterium]